MADVTFLIVDDEPTTITILKASIEATIVNCKVIAYEDGAEALEYLSRAAVDVIISDYDMPHLNGMGLLTWLKNFRHLENVRFFMISTEYDRTLIDDAEHLGAVHWFVKPINTGLIKALMKRLIKIGINKDLIFKDSRTLRGSR